MIRTLCFEDLTALNHPLVVKDIKAIASEELFEMDDDSYRDRQRERTKDRHRSRRGKSFERQDWWQVQ